MVSQSSRQLTRETVEIVSLGLEDHGLRSQAALKSAAAAHKRRVARHGSTGRRQIIYR